MNKAVNYIKDEIVTVSIYDVNEYPMHHHKDPEIIFVINGRAAVHTSFYSIESIKENDFIFINADTIHNIERVGSEPCRIMSIHFHMTGIAALYNVPVFSAFSIASFDEYSPQQTIEQLRRYIIDIAVCYLRDADYKTGLPDMVLECYTYMMNNFQWFYYDDYILHNYPQRLPLTQITRAEEILTYMQEHYSRKLTLSNVADAFYLNKYYLSHLLKDTLGMSFQDLLNAIRLNIALYPLLESGKSVEEIAEECGFSSAAYLRKAFAVHAKTSLSGYRKRYGKKASGSGNADIISCGREKQCEYLMSYRRKYYPEDFLEEKTQRLPVHISLANTAEVAQHHCRQLRVTPQTLFHLDRMREALEEITFDRIFAVKDQFTGILEAYGSWKFMEPVKSLCREFHMELQMVCGEEALACQNTEAPAVLGGESSMYAEKGFRTKWYYFYFLKNQLYDEVIFDEKFCTVTRQDRKISILCNNAAQDKYGSKPCGKEIFLHIEGIQCNYSILTYTMQFDGKDEVKMWRDIGAPQCISRNLRETIRCGCFPEISCTHSTAQYDLLKGITLNPGEIKLLLLIPDEEAARKD